MEGKTNERILAEISDEAILATAAEVDKKIDPSTIFRVLQQKVPEIQRGSAYYIPTLVADFSVRVAQAQANQAARQS